MLILSVVCGLMVLLLLGVPVAFSLGAVSVVALYLTQGGGALSAVSDIAWGTTSEFLLVAIPLFILMSELISASGVGKDLFTGVERWTGWLPGGVAMSAIVASAIFGAVSGTAVGVAAVIAGVAIPEMLRRNYSPEMASGTVAAASGLGMVIPPSLPIIIYGVVTETSVTTLFAKAVVPGIFVTLVCCLYVLVQTMREARKGRVLSSGGEEISLGRSLVLAGPTALLIFIVLGSIYKGIATPTEAAAVGVCGALGLVAYKRALSKDVLVATIVRTVKTSIMLLTILLAAMLFSYMLSALQIPQTLAEQVIEAKLSGWVFFVVVMVLLFFLGMFLDVVSVILIAVPIVFPTLVAYGYDPIWFGVVLMINMCFAVVTPPVGLCLYVVRDSVKGLTLGQVVRGTMPFLFLYAFSILVMTLFPGIVTGF
ncbi:TRAP transporter large permease [Denitromonas sp.]|uniref:TRAP transporter large permease n=1 Tax=Denitromonas sp. TaxID=2734609 RepID=UPI003A8397DA